ncbi:MAG TPA: hypothetical protein VK447_20125 [Myxococcaceae bacterium]|nr:hypothetical protein [Myxococcaceae bacterium]
MLRPLLLLSLFLLPASALAQSNAPTEAITPKADLSPPPLTDAPEQPEPKASATQPPSRRPSTLNTSVARGDDDGGRMVRLLTEASLGTLGGAMGGLLGGVVGSGPGLLVGYAAGATIVVYSMGTILGAEGGDIKQALLGAVLGTAVGVGLAFVVAFAVAPAAGYLSPTVYVLAALCLVPGALIGAIFFENSVPPRKKVHAAPSGVKVAPTMGIMPGGGLLGGLVGTF